METNTARTLATKHMILIDDDPTYCAIMERAAKMNGVHLETFKSAADLSVLRLEFNSQETPKNYIAALVDYDLGSTTGVAIAEFLAGLLGDLPIIVVSSKQRLGIENWPSNIVKFVCKSEGYGAVIKAAEDLNQNPRMTAFSRELPGCD